MPVTSPELATSWKNLSRQEAKKSANHDQRQRRLELGQNMSFSGSIKSLKKAELQDLCWALKLDESGTVDDMKKRVLQVFDASPDLKTAVQFRSLFERSRSQKRVREADDADPEGREHPPAPPQDIQQLHIDPTLLEVNLSGLIPPPSRPPLGNRTNQV